MIKHSVTTEVSSINNFEKGVVYYSRSMNIEFTFLSLDRLLSKIQLGISGKTKLISISLFYKQYFERGIVTIYKET